jgi:predicted membrane channel-forming protein YqfA (hemolysin III family)
MERALRIAGVLLVIGLVVEALSLHWNTAFSFLSFMIVGGILLVAGVLLYLISLLQHTHQGKSTRDL